jgi:hypothetical protein
MIYIKNSKKSIENEKSGLRVLPLRSPFAKVAKWRSFRALLARLSNVKTTSCFAAAFAFC